MNDNKRAWHIAVMRAGALLALVSGCIEEEIPPGGPRRGCEYEGERYRVGESFPASDGCNTCQCSVGGAVACTLRLCVPEDAGPEEGCELGNITLPEGEGVICPDGCNSCGCNDGQLVQTLIGCAPLPQIEICEGPAPDDAPSFGSLYLAQDAWAVAITYGGGCAEHSFRLCTDGSFLESSPVQLRVWVVDEGEPDPCLALPTEQKVFDLSPIREWYEQAYQTDTGTVILNTRQGGVRYTF